MRAARIRNEGFDEDGLLETAARGEIVSEFFKNWKRRPDVQEQLRELQGRTATEDSYNRTVASNWRAYCFQMFGGLGWVSWYAALGGIPPSSSSSWMNTSRG